MGFVRPAEHGGAFSRRDDPAARRFYTLDPAKIGARSASPTSRRSRWSRWAPPDAGARARDRLPRPPNDHLCYAHHLVWPRRRAGRSSFRRPRPEDPAAMTAYDRLATRFARIATVGEAQSVLGWDARP